MSTPFPTQIVNRSEVIAKPCPIIPPVIVTYFQNSSIGWNAVLVGLLSSVLAILFLLTCLYYFLCRRRYNHLSEIPTPVALVEKNGRVPVASSSQTATTTFMNEPGKETKVTTYSEQSKVTATNTEFVNGHTVSNGLVANGNTDPSALRLLQHEHH